MKRDLLDESMHLTNRLREEYFKTNDHLEKGKYKMKLKFFPGGKQHYDFDMNSQQFLQQHLEKISFQPPEVQEHFLQQIAQLFDEDIVDNQKITTMAEKIAKDCNISLKNDPRSTRELLSTHFHNRITQLRHKKHLTMLRYHNHVKITQESLRLLQNRLYLIDLQIQAALNRKQRLKINDFFEESYSINKPMAKNEMGTQSYRALDEEQCKFSNVSRDDIEIYLRNEGHRENILKHYWSLHHQVKYISLRYPVALLDSVQNKIFLSQANYKKEAYNRASEILKWLGDAPQDVTSFIYRIYGAEEYQPLLMPLYPNIRQELINKILKALTYQFQALEITLQNFSVVIPKLTNFVAIIYKYQNKDSILEKQQIKLGLQDEVDLRKQLCALLEETWVKKHIRLNYQVYDIKYVIVDSSWPEHTYSRRKIQKVKQTDYECKTIIGYLDVNDYNIWRKYVKEYSQRICGRLVDKFRDCHNCRLFQLTSKEKANLEYLNELYHVKNQSPEKTARLAMKQQLMTFFNTINKSVGITNPVEIETLFSLLTIEMRQTRRKIRNYVNASRCYFKRLSYDLKAFSLLPKDYEMDDSVIIDSKKEEREEIERFWKEATGPSITIPNFNKKINDNSINKEIPKDREIHYYDRVVLHQHEPVVIGRDPNKFLLYDITFKDMIQLQQRILHNASKYINKFEGYIKVKGLEPVVDRHELLCDLYEAELKFQMQKFELLEVMMLIYDHIVEPSDRHKLAERMFKTMLVEVTVDDKQPYFTESYKIAGEILSREKAILWRSWQQVVNEEVRQVNAFHKRLSKLIKVPYYKYGLLYGDLDLGGKNLSRTASLASIKSGRSRSSHGNKQQIRLKKQQEIIEVDEQVDFSDESETQKNQDQIDLIAHYDQYLLSRDLDQIFDEIAREDPSLKKDKDVNNIMKEQVSAENNMVHRRFEGGPHYLIQLGNKIELARNHKIEFMNFFDYAHYVTNLLTLVQENQRDLQERYGFCGIRYQAQLKLAILQHAVKIVLSPDPLPKTIKTQYHWDQNYMLVVRNLKHYKEIMKDNVDPMPYSSLALLHALPKHIDGIPPFNQIQHLDYHQLQCLTELKKPKNIVNYRQLMLAINLIGLFRLDCQLRQVALQRKQISKCYKSLGKQLGVDIKKYGSEYQRVSDSVFTSVQALKISNFTDLLTYGLRQQTDSILFPDAINELKIYVMSEKANIWNFYTFVKFERQKFDSWIRGEHQLIFASKCKAYYKNGIILTNRINLYDDNTMKTLISRWKSLMSTAVAQFRETTFAKSKISLKSMLDRKLKEATTKIYGEKTSEDKATKLLNQKKIKMVAVQLIQLHSQDVLKIAQERSVTIELLLYARSLRKQFKSLPFGNKLWSEPDCNHLLQEKFYFDQKNRRGELSPFGRVYQLDTGRFINPFYIYSQEQIFQQILPVEFTTKLELFEIQKCQTIWLSTHPPSDPEQLYKWFFKQTEKGLPGHQMKSFKYVQKLNKYFVGSNIKFEEEAVDVETACSANRLLPLLQHYRKVHSYLQQQMIVMSFCGCDVDTLNQLVRQQKVFDELYSLLKVEEMDDDKTPASLKQRLIEHENELYENIQKNMASVLYVYEVKEMILLNKTRKALEAHKHKDEPIRANNNIIIDETMDFLIQRVQGLGVVRQAFLPLIEQMKLISEAIISSNSNKVLQLRTNNIQKTLYLGLQELQRNWEGRQEQLKQLRSLWFEYHQVGKFKLDSARYYPLNQNQLFLPGESEKYVFAKKLERVKYDLFYKLRCALLNSPIDVNKYMYSYWRQTTANQFFYVRESHIAATDNLRLEELRQKTWKMVSHWNQQDRLRMLARLKHVGELQQQFLQFKSIKKQQILKGQEQKQDYLRLLCRNALLFSALIYFQKQVFLPLSLKQASEFYTQLMQLIDSRAVSVLNNFESYSDKLAMTKQQKLLLSTSLNLTLRQNQQQMQIHSRVLRQVLYLKLLRQELRCRLLKTNIDILVNERLQQNQTKKTVINPGLLPRVKMNSCFSSPLLVDRKTYLPQQVKLCFVQAFINRMRNKVSRVDLLSSGYGFVITVSDLQDCVNFLNKSLFTFSQKEFKYRLDTFGQYFEMLAETIEARNKEITQLKSINEILKNKLSSVNQTVYIEKVNNLLIRNTVLNDKIKTVEEASKGLEDRLRKALNLEYQDRLSRLTTENTIIKKKFREFQDLMTTLTKSEARSTFLSLVNELKIMSSDLLQRTVDLAAHIPQKQEKQEKNEGRAKEYPAWDQEKRGNELILQPDIQKCAIGQDIIHDPYYVTKLINKMRIFNILKLSARRHREQVNNDRINKQLGNLNRIHDSTILQTKKELILRQEFTEVQENLARTTAQLEYYKVRCDALQGQNEKLKIQNLTKDKKLQQKTVTDTKLQPQIAELKTTLADRDSRIQKLEQKQKSLDQSMHKLRSRQRAKIKMLNLTQMKQFSQTQPLMLLDQGALQLSNKEATWQEKCQQLYNQNRNLQRQLDKLRADLEVARVRGFPAIDSRQTSSQKDRNGRSVLSETEKGRSGEVTERKKKFNVSYKFKLGRDYLPDMS